MDIGAETPEEIALAILAEIKAVCMGRSAGFLKDRRGPIHDRAGIGHFSVGPAGGEVTAPPRRSEKEAV
jgi:hypothetical protein